MMVNFEREKTGKGEIAMKTKKSSSKGVCSDMRSDLIENAKELSILCDAVIAIIDFSKDGELFEFATSSDAKTIYTRYKNFLKSLPKRPASKTKLQKQKPMQVDTLRQEAQKPKLKKWKLLGKDLKKMSIGEVVALEEKITEGMLHIKDRKMQILMKELEQSRKQEELTLQTYQALQGMLCGLSPPTNYPVPLSVHIPGSEGNVGPAERRILPSTSFADNEPAGIRLISSRTYAARHAINIRPADRMFLPSTSCAAPLAIDNGPETERAVGPAVEELDTTLALGRTWN